VRVIKNTQFLSQFQPGEILVTDKTDPDWEPIMKKAAAIVTNRGGRTCHAAIVSRELGLPAVVGTERGTEALRERAGGHRVVRRGRRRLRLQRPHELPG
jgi:pyruvate,water dikinase